MLLFCSFFHHTVGRVWLFHDLIPDDLQLVKLVKISRLTVWQLEQDVLDYTAKASNVVCYPISLDLKPRRSVGSEVRLPLKIFRFLQPFIRGTILLHFSTKCKAALLSPLLTSPGCCDSSLPLWSWRVYGEGGSLSYLSPWSPCEKQHRQVTAKDADTHVQTQTPDGIAL